MTRSLMVGLVAGMLLLTACNDPNKNSSTMTTDDTSYPSTKSDSSNTYSPSNTSSSNTTGTTYPPIYTTTTVTPASGDTSGSSGTTNYSSTPSGSYNTTATSPPVTTTVISPAGSSNAEMSGDESLSPGSQSKSRSGGSGQTYTVKSGDSLSKILQEGLRRRGQVEQDLQREQVEDLESEQTEGGHEAGHSVDQPGASEYLGGPAR